MQHDVNNAADITRLVGHNGTAVTAAVYLNQIRRVMKQGAPAMNRIFPAGS